MHYLLALLIICFSYISINAKVFPIQFSIPEVKIVNSIPEKDRDFASLIPGNTSTYIYQEEADYYQGYQRSYFALTWKKGGWDCMRHYEILANGCIPYFIDLDKCNPNTMVYLPKQLIWEAMHLPGVSYPNIDHTKFDKAKYYEILNKLIAHTRAYLTTRNMAQYMMSVLDYRGSGKILYLSKDVSPDYLRECVLIGLKDLFGSRIVDFPKIDFLYNNYEGDIKLLYGKGFSYTKILDDVWVDRSIIEERIKNKEFDLIVYGSVHRGLLYHDLVCQTYPPHKIIYVCGEDAHHCPFTCVENLFLREFDALK